MCVLFIGGWVCSRRVVCGGFLVSHSQMISSNAARCLRALSPGCCVIRKCGLRGAAGAVAVVPLVCRSQWACSLLAQWVPERGPFSFHQSPDAIPTYRNRSRHWPLVVGRVPERQCGAGRSLVVGGVWLGWGAVRLD